MGALDYLANLNVRHPIAHTWNQMLKELERRLPKWVNVGWGTNTFIHPFYTTAITWDDMPAWAPYDPKRVWRVDVVSGCVNDAVCSIAYKATGDPRGWTMSADYPFAPGSTAAVIDRPLYDKSDPIPFLTMQTPSADLSDMQTFVPVNDSARPPFFRTAEMWEQSLFVTSVMVSTSPSLAVVFDPSLAAALTRRFRVFVGLPQTSLVTNVREIARLYLTRDPTNKPELDQIYVLQQCYWDLQAMIVQGGMSIFATAAVVANIGVDPTTSAMGSLAADALIEMAMPLSYTAWWTS